MARFCVECGSELNEDVRFCGDCGRQIAAPDTEITATNVAVSSPEDEQAVSSTSKPKRRRSGAVAAGAAAVAAVLGLTILAVSSQGSEEVSQTAAESQPSVSASTDPSPGASKKPKAMKPDTSTPQPPPPPPPAATAPNSTGYWEGTMDNGEYSYYMQIEESNGQVAGWIQQWDTDDGESGTEYFTGTRTGNTLKMRGYEWSPETPSTWKLDTFTLKLNNNGQGMSGSYECDGCSSGSKSMWGERTSGDYAY